MLRLIAAPQSQVPQSRRRCISGKTCGICRSYSVSCRADAKMLSDRGITWSAPCQSVVEVQSCKRPLFAVTRFDLVDKAVLPEHTLHRAQAFQTDQRLRDRAPYLVWFGTSLQQLARSCPSPSYPCCHVAQDAIRARPASVAAQGSGAVVHLQNYGSNSAMLSRCASKNLHARPGTCSGLQIKLGLPFLMSRSWCTPPTAAIRLPFK
jgi:hypothetical protein